MVLAGKRNFTVFMVFEGERVLRFVENFVFLVFAKKTCFDVKVYFYGFEGKKNYFGGQVHFYEKWDFGKICVL